MANVDIRLQRGTATARIDGVATPTSDNDAANKAYVDSTNNAFRVIAEFTLNTTDQTFTGGTYDAGTGVISHNGITQNSIVTLNGVLLQEGTDYTVDDGNNMITLSSNVRGNIRASNNWCCVVLDNSEGFRGAPSDDLDQGTPYEEGRTYSNDQLVLFDGNLYFWNSINPSLPNVAPNTEAFTTNTVRISGNSNTARANAANNIINGDFVEQTTLNKRIVDISGTHTVESAANSRWFYNTARDVSIVEERFNTTGVNWNVIPGRFSASQYNIGSTLFVPTAGTTASAGSLILNPGTGIPGQTGGPLFSTQPSPREYTDPAGPILSQSGGGTATYHIPVINNWMLTGTTIGDVNRIQPITETVNIMAAELNDLDADNPTLTRTITRSGSIVATVTFTFRVAGLESFIDVRLDTDVFWVYQEGTLGTNDLNLQLVTGNAHEWERTLNIGDVRDISITILDTTSETGIFYEEASTGYRIRLDDPPITENQVRNLGYDTTNNLDLRYQAIAPATGDDSYVRTGTLSDYVQTSTLNTRLPVTITRDSTFPSGASNGDQHFLTDNILSSTTGSTTVTRNVRFPTTSTSNTLQGLVPVPSTRPDIAGTPAIVAGTVEVSDSSETIASTTQSRTFSGAGEVFTFTGGRDHSFRGVGVQRVFSGGNQGQTFRVSVYEHRYNTVRHRNTSLTPNEDEVIIGATWHDYFYQYSSQSVLGGFGRVIRTAHLTAIRLSDGTYIGEQLTNANAIERMETLIQDDSSLIFGLHSGAATPSSVTSRSNLPSTTVNVRTNVGNQPGTRYNFIPMNGFRVDIPNTTITGVTITTLADGSVNIINAGGPVNWQAAFTRDFTVPLPANIEFAPGQYVYDDITSGGPSNNWRRLTYT